MGILRLSLNQLGLSNPLLKTPTVGRDRKSLEILKKSFGEKVPQLVDISHNPLIAPLYGPKGVAERVRRKLNTLSRKNGKIVPAKGVIASALSSTANEEGEDQVFLGVEFLEEYHQEVETVAGILSHEWGHLVSNFPFGIDPDDLTWRQIFDFRKEEEEAADIFAGKMLYRMGYFPEKLFRFLSQSRFQKDSNKYHPIPVRIALIREAFEEERHLHQQARHLFPSTSYGNPLSTQLIAVA